MPHQLDNDNNNNNNPICKAPECQKTSVALPKAEGHEARNYPQFQAAFKFVQTVPEFVNSSN